MFKVLPLLLLSRSLRKNILFYNIIMVNFLKLSFLLFTVSLVCSVPVPEVPIHIELSKNDSHPIIFQDNVEQLNHTISENITQSHSRKLLRRIRKTVSSIFKRSPPPPPKPAPAPKAAPKPAPAPKAAPKAAATPNTSTFLHKSVGCCGGHSLPRRPGLRRRRGSPGRAWPRSLAEEPGRGA